MTLTALIDTSSLFPSLSFEGSDRVFSWAPQGCALAWGYWGAEDTWEPSLWLDSKLCDPEYDAYIALLESYVTRIRAVLGDSCEIETYMEKKALHAPCDVSLRIYGGGSLSICLAKRRWAPGHTRHGASLSGHHRDFTWFGGKEVGFYSLPEDEWCEALAEQVLVALQNQKADYIKQFGEVPAGDW